MNIGHGDAVKKGNQTNLFSIKIWPWMLVLIVICFIVNGCTTVGPNLEKPEPQILDDWAEVQKIGLSIGKTDYSAWWQVFDDPVLQKLVELAYRQNLSLQMAGIRIYEARAQLGIAVGGLYPQSQLTSGALTTNKMSSLNDVSMIDNHFSSLSLGFDAAWELDVWGKNRRTVESGVANLEASVASYDNALVSLTAEVARTYIVMRTLEKRLEIAHENIGLQKRSLEIAEIRFTEGAVSELDVTQARSLLTDTQALTPRLESSLRQTQNALAILMGVLPRTLTDMLAGPAKIPTALETITIDIPNNLLRRRPDIRLSELQVATQSPQIGIAKADLYPHFFLFGSIGWSSSNATTISSQNSLSDIFSYKSLFWSAGPGFSWDIFNYGRIRNKVRVEDARFQQYVVNYKNTVLNAQREVEDAMVAYTRSKEEEHFLKASVDAGKRSVELSMIQYREGVVDYQRVLDSQRFLSSQSDRLTEVSGQVGTNLVATYKALGGGWQIREGEAYLSEENRNKMDERTNWGGLLDISEPDPTGKIKNKEEWRWPDW
jgi:NodT family efflux transporter outer membrane factor (OMF) lipoprotein